jgi:UDP-N-acetylglucosamine--N-acetylmuramyl-(pentapeptide) pyrophosphoryl-undecaprenol N-acetylglucosamine transferase
VAKDVYIVFAAGGTGGHLFPAIAVAQAMRVRHPGATIVFVGGTRGLETRLVPQAGFPLRALRLSGLKGSSLLRQLTAASAAAFAVVRCVAWFLRRRPGLVVGAGGYASGPAVLAAWLLRVPTMLMEQNHFPGVTNRWLAARVDAIGLPSEAAKQRLGGRGVVTGNPVRAEFTAIGPPPNADRIALLVFGGSRGARSINRALVAALPRLALITPPPRVVHQTGPEDYEAISRAYALCPGLAADVRPFLDDMPRRLAEADLVVCRAGATTLAELAAAGRPAILVPFPFAADDHQRANAVAVQEAGAAVMVEDRDLEGERFTEELVALASDRPRRLRMAAAARSLARPDATARIADMADELVSHTEGPHVP